MSQVFSAEDADNFPPQDYYAVAVQESNQRNAYVSVYTEDRCIEIGPYGDVAGTVQAAASFARLCTAARRLVGRLPCEFVTRVKS